MDEFEFKQLVEKTIREATMDAITPQVAAVCRKIQEQQQAGTGKSGTGPTPSKAEFMRKCIAAGGNEVSCEAQWQAQVTLLEEANAILKESNRTYKNHLKNALVRISETCGVMLHEGVPSEREEILPRLRRRYVEP